MKTYVVRFHAGKMGIRDEQFMADSILTARALSYEWQCAMLASDDSNLAWCLRYDDGTPASIIDAWAKNNPKEQWIGGNSLEHN
jgi:hypothetical protein